MGELSLLQQQQQNTAGEDEDSVDILNEGQSSCHRDTDTARVFVLLLLLVVVEDKANRRGAPLNTSLRDGRIVTEADVDKTNKTRRQFKLGTNDALRRKELLRD